MRLCAFALKAPASSHDQASIKAKTPAIVPHQGKSRQPMKNLNATITSANGAASYQPRATPWERANRLSSALKGRPIPPIKAKTPVIVPHQGKSRQTPKSKIPVCLANPPAGWGGPAGEWSKRVPRRNPLPVPRSRERERVAARPGEGCGEIQLTVGERKQVRASVPLNCPAASLCLRPPIKAENPFNRA